MAAELNAGNTLIAAAVRAIDQRLSVRIARPISYVKELALRRVFLAEQPHLRLAYSHMFRTHRVREVNCRF